MSLRFLRFFRSHTRAFIVIDNAVIACVAITGCVLPGLVGWLVEEDAWNSIKAVITGVLFHAVVSPCSVTIFLGVFLSE